MFDIRKISDVFREVHSRYYVDTNGSVYTSLSPKTSRITVKGKLVSIGGFRSENLRRLDKNANMIVRFEDTEYFLLYDGTILKRLKTILSKGKIPSVSIMRVYGGNNTGNHYIIARLVAGVFIGDVSGKEVHHIDQNPLNNKVENLQILTLEEHRGRENFLRKHSKLSSPCID